jgi:hypothetical protein
MEDVCGDRVGVEKTVMGGEACKGVPRIVGVDINFRRVGTDCRSLSKWTV